jgi:mRNA-degrading endonuclease RelE of RelBE toxin-antitoxin system
LNASPKKLRKRFPNVMRDVEPLIAELESGLTPGDELQRLPYRVCKAHVVNSDAQRGKSGGYRVIYFVRVVDSIYLIAIYSKTDTESLSDAFIVAAIEDALSEPEDE